MPRADLVLDLVSAERHGDRDRFKAIVETLIAEERSAQHHLVADRLSEIITTTGERSRAIPFTVKASGSTASS